MKNNVIIKITSFMLIFAMMITMVFSFPAHAVVGGESAGEGTTAEGTTEEDLTSGIIGEGGLEKLGNTIEPQWRVTNHNDICDYVAAQLSLSASQKSWIKETCKAADANYSKVKAFHARKKADCNYIASLKALWMFSKLLGTDNKIQTILNSMPNLDANNKTYITEMCQTVQAYLKSKGSITKEHKQCLVYGFALHIMGDTYAHRILVKKASLDHWDEADTSTNKYLQKRDFLTTSKENNKYTYTAFNAGVNAGTIYTGDIKDYMYNGDFDPVENNTFQFKLNYKAGDPASNKTTTAGLVYIDNPTFMPKRFSAAKQASVSFIKNVRKSNGNFSDVSFYRDTYSLTIDKFAAYKTAAN